MFICNGITPVTVGFAAGRYTTQEGDGVLSICVSTPDGILGSNLLVNVSLSESTDG